MTVAPRKSLEEYLRLQYPFTVSADPDGGFVIAFPDLPGCVTQAEEWAEIGAMADDARRLWLESAYQQEELDISLPSYLEEHSGKLNLRLPRSLHRRLVEAAEREGVSLNSHIVELLSRRDPQAEIQRRLGAIEGLLGRMKSQDHPKKLRAHSDDRAPEQLPQRTIKQSV